MRPRTKRWLTLTATSLCLSSSLYAAASQTNHDTKVVVANPFSQQQAVVRANSMAALSAQSAQNFNLTALRANRQSGEAEVIAERSLLPGKGHKHRPPIGANKRGQAKPHSHADHRRLSFDELTQPQSDPQLTLHQTLAKQSFEPNKNKFAPTAQSAAAAACDMNGYASKTGQALVDHIRTQDNACINDLFTANATSFSAFRSSNMVYVANATASIAQGYTTSGPNDIGKLYYFLRAGYYIEYYNPNNVGPYGTDVQNAVRGALDALFNTSAAWSSSDQNGKNIGDAITLIDSAGEQARYLWVVKRWLTDWNSNDAQHWNLRSAVNNIFTVLFRGHQETDFQNAVKNDTALIQRLGSFARSDWMLTTDALYLQENAAGELARFLQYDTAPIYPTVKSELQALFNRYAMNGTGKSVWIRAATVVDYYNKCAEFNICGFKAQLEAEVLSITHQCSSTLTIRAQEMTSAQLNDSCNQLAEEETYFHQKLATNNQPVANDNNNHLEMVIFNSSNDYKTYSGLFFGNSTNNGGIYLEGDPAAAGNQARFIAYEAEWMLPEFHVWNLKHEYVHYLDGRFDMLGGFGDYLTADHKTVWWLEGLAEYISKQDFNDEAITQARTRAYALSTIFNNDYNSGQDRVYRWGYLAVRFMFENHHGEVDTFLNYFRAGNYDGYLSFVNSIGSLYDNEWYNWLDTVQSTQGGGNTDPGNGTGQALTNGETRTGISATTGNDQIFYVDVPAGATDLTFSISGGSGDADLYTQFNAEPTDNSYVCRPYIGGNSETCSEANPSAGRWYVRVKAYSTFDNVSLTVSFIEDTGGGGGGNTLPDACATQSPFDYGNVTSGNAICVPANSGTNYYYTYIDSGTSSLTIQLDGAASGNADLFANANTWATASSYTASSTNSGNTESITVNNPPTGWFYFSVVANPDKGETILLINTQ